MSVSCKLTIPNSDGNPFGTCTSPGLSPLAANRRTIRHRNIHGKDASFSVISTGPSRGRTDMSESVARWHLWPRRFLSHIAPLIRQHKKTMVRLNHGPLALQFWVLRIGRGGTYLGFVVRRFCFDWHVDHWIDHGFTSPTVHVLGRNTLAYWCVGSLPPLQGSWWHGCW